MMRISCWVDGRVGWTVGLAPDSGNDPAGGQTEITDTVSSSGLVT